MMEYLTGVRIVQFTVSGLFLMKNVKDVEKGLVLRMANSRYSPSNVLEEFISLFVKQGVNDGK